MIFSSPLPIPPPLFISLKSMQDGKTENLEDQLLAEAIALSLSGGAAGEGTTGGAPDAGSTGGARFVVY